MTSRMSQDTKDGESDLYFSVRQLDQAGKDVKQVWVIEDRDGNVLTSEESMLRRWKEYFVEIMKKMRKKEGLKMWKLRKRKLKRIVKMN